MKISYGNQIKSFLTIGFLFFYNALLAKPEAPELFCAHYPQSPFCHQQSIGCEFCHSQVPSLNLYGGCLQENLMDAAFSEALPNAFSVTDPLDCDGDGTNNSQEISEGFFPGDSNSKPQAVPEPGPSQDEKTSYDYSFAYKNIFRDFCGTSPSFEIWNVFQSLADEDKHAHLLSTLESCLQSPYWRGKDGALWKMAHERITPFQTAKAGEDQGTTPLGDYYDDYNLFVYHNIDDNDIRGILTADYFVARNDELLTYTKVDDVPLHPAITSGSIKSTSDRLELPFQQFVTKTARAGMLTTLYNLFLRTMLSSIPRNTASHALRHYLGMDIAKGEGLDILTPNDAQFTLIDHDSKGITDEACAFCHKALDANSYVFTPYNGLLVPIGVYEPNRISLLSQLRSDTEPFLSQTPSSGFLFGEPVANLVEWAQKAANSDYFAKKVVLDYWKFLFGHAPKEHEQETYNGLWQNLKTVHNYKIKNMLQELILKEVYGVP